MSRATSRLVDACEILELKGYVDASSSCTSSSSKTVVQSNSSSSSPRF
jgi:hypothetical protein